MSKQKDQLLVRTVGGKNQIRTSSIKLQSFRSLPSKALSQTCKGVEPQQRKEKRLVKQREVSEYFCDNGKASGIFY